jgi:hypothetical protein
MPDTNPNVGLMVATVVALLDQVPPETALAKGKLPPTHTDDKPVIAATGVTVTAWVV